MSDRPKIWIDTDHRLLTDALSHLLVKAGFQPQSDADDATVCLRDHSLSRTRVLEPPTIPTIGLVHKRISSHELLEFLTHGYRGYITSDADVQTLVDSIRAVINGEVIVEPHILLLLFQPHRADQLTAREREVLGYLRLGWTNHQIADQLGITYKTVKAHVSAILSKHGARHRIELVVGQS